MEDIELNSCPFCGCSVQTHAHEHSSGVMGYMIVGNHETGCYLKQDLNDFETMEEAIMAWNRRVIK